VPVRIRAVCFDWGNTLMLETGGPPDVPMALWPEVRAVPGAAAMLASLHGRVPLCIATNAAVSHRPMIERALERAGLLHFFTEVFCYAELGVRKESPEFWAIVLRTLDVEPSGLAMLGDSLECDVLVPRALGIQAVWFDALRAPAPASVPTICELGAFVPWVLDRV
jgi:FMN phosphatase YigB (HAD superfamily)